MCMCVLAQINDLTNDLFSEHRTETINNFDAGISVGEPEISGLGFNFGEFYVNAYHFFFGGGGGGG